MADVFEFLRHQSEALTARARADDDPAQPPARARRPRWTWWRRLFPQAPRPTAFDYAVAEAWARAGGGPTWDQLPLIVQRHRAHGPVTRAAVAAAIPTPDADHLTLYGLAAEVTVWQTPTPGAPPRLAHRLVVDPRCLVLRTTLDGDTVPLVQHRPPCECGSHLGRLVQPAPATTQETRRG